MRTVVGRAAAAKIFKQRKKNADDDPNALVFPIHYREAFTELLKAANLHIDQRTKFQRNFKSLRATAISFRILESEQPNLLMIARNAGTSVQMIDQFSNLSKLSLCFLQHSSRPSLRRAEYLHWGRYRISSDSLVLRK